MKLMERRKALEEHNRNKTLLNKSEYNTIRLSSLQGFPINQRKRFFKSQSVRSASLRRNEDLEDEEQQLIPNSSDVNQEKSESLNVDQMTFCEVIRVLISNSDFLFLMLTLTGFFYITSGLTFWCKQYLMQVL